MAVKKPRDAAAKGVVTNDDTPLPSNGAVGKAKKATAPRAKAPRRKRETPLYPHGLSVTAADDALPVRAKEEDQPPAPKRAGRAKKSESAVAVGPLSGEDGKQPAPKVETDASESGEPEEYVSLTNKKTNKKTTKAATKKKPKLTPTNEAKPKKKAAPKAPKTVLGVTPYPDHVRPTPEECYQVHDILTKKHGEFKVPETPPIPSGDVAGCGEVVFVLEALIRTLLSGHTSMENANRAIKGLLERYPTYKEGPFKGSTNWDNVRTTPREDLEKAIRSGGMAPTKSKHIKQILDDVYEENQALKAQLMGQTEGELESDIKADGDQEAEGVTKEEVVKQGPNDEDTTVVIEKPNTPIDALRKAISNKDDTTKEAIMARLAADTITGDSGVLTLDYMHAMDESTVFEKLQKYSNIGVKTAACLLLFCMQKEFYAVDTHVWRISKWLGWVPAKADRDKTFAHCNVRVPGELRYGLHQLMIRHGKECVKCFSNSSTKTNGWNDECVLEDLVTRVKASDNKPAKPTKRKKGESDEDEDEGQDVAEDDTESPPPKKRTRTKKTADVQGEPESKLDTEAKGKRPNPKVAAKSKATPKAKKAAPAKKAAQKTATRTSARGKKTEPVDQADIGPSDDVDEEDDGSELSAPSSDVNSEFES